MAESQVITVLKVDNKKAVRRLSDKSFRAAKSRNIIAVCAIALTALLFTTLFTIGSGIVENFQRQTMRQAGGDGMGVLKYITDEEYENIKEHELLTEISYNRILCDSVDNETLLKRRGEFYYMDDTAMKLGFCEPTTGHKPEKANEIIMDTKTIKMLGLPQELGAPLTLELTVHGQKVSRDFVLCGWWEADPVFNVSMMVTSRAYVDEHIGELHNSYKQNSEMTGVINCYMMFRNSFNLENKVERVITESGYSMDENAANFIASNVNWSYLSTNFSMDPGTVAGALAALLLIILTGYLIIYNIFQISVIKDIRFYGLLKTIGTTGKQIKRIIRRQALLLSCIGIPIGLVAGFFIGCGVVPVIMNQTYAAGAQFSTEANPLIFIGSTLFALITIAISTSKPGRIAAGVSPVEAVRYTENSGRGRKKKRRGRHGSLLAGMAGANMGRNRKRTVLVVLSMSLSLVLFNTLYTFSLGFDMDKFLSTFVDTDFLIAHADYFNYDFTGTENSVSEQMMEAVRQQPGFEEGGRLFANADAEAFSVEDTDSTVQYNRHLDGNPMAIVYGLDDLPLYRLDVLEGEIDVDKLKSGDYILEGVALHDDGSPRMESSHFSIGDTVTLHNYKGDGETARDNEYATREFTVMAKVAIHNYTNSCGRGYDYSFYIPSTVYTTMVNHPGVMSYAYNVADSEEQGMEAFLQKYTESVEPVMNYSSKAVRVKEFEGMRNMVLLVGGMLSLIIGLIGILNFINSMLTSIITRRREFAMLQSIGMTNRQLRRLLVCEGLCYTAAAGAVSLVLSVLFSAVIVKAISANLWFFSYQFTILPLIVTIPVILAVGLLLPVIVLRTVTKQSVVDRLREAEA